MIHEAVFHAGRWHAAYRMPGTDAWSSVLSAPTYAAAAKEAARLTTAPPPPEPIDPADRQIPFGFYQDE